MTGNIYHITNRGVEKRNIFLDEDDRLRFVSSLYTLNDKESSIKTVKIDTLNELPIQNKLVNILKWTLMNNHYHLLLEEVIENGATAFIKKLGNGYTKYFNIKNNRSGYLFQNSAKLIKLTDPSHFSYVPFYIDLNPLKILKSRRTENTQKILKLLKSYRWSSYRDYLGLSNFPYIINVTRFYELFDTNKNSYFKELNEWITERHHVNLPR